jgi:hypothetical protein
MSDSGNVHHPFTAFKKAHDLVRKEVLYNNLNEFAIPMKIFQLIKMCLNTTYIRITRVNICMINFLLRMISNKEILYDNSF